jgi:hypothetical protein
LTFADLPGLNRKCKAGEERWIASNAPFRGAGIYNIVGPNMMKGFKPSEMKAFLLGQELFDLPL